MSDFEDKLNTLLNDPASMAQIMQLAQTLSGEGSGDSSAVPPQSPPAEEDFGIDTQMLQRFMPILREMRSANNSETAQFLRALRPYLRAEKQEKVEKAVQIARLIRIGKSFFRSLEENDHV